MAGLRIFVTILLAGPLMACTEIGQPLVGASLGSLSDEIGCLENSSATQSRKLSPSSATKVQKVHFPEREIRVGQSKLSSASTAVPVGTRLSLVFEASCFESHTESLIEKLEVFGEPKVHLLSGSLLLMRLRVEGQVAWSSLEDSMAALECLQTVETPVRYQKANLPTDPLLPAQDYLETVRMLESFESYEALASQAAQTVPVAVIDSGMDLDHPDLQGQLWVNSGEVPGDDIDNDGNGYVDDVHGYNFFDGNGDPDPAGYRTASNSHGTAVAGLIAAEVNSQGMVGLAPFGVELMSLNVFGESDGASAADVAEAILYAVDQGAKVVNMSLTGAQNSTVLRLAMEEAARQGTTLVSAAGNFGVEIEDAADYTPGSFSFDIDGAINVGAINTTDRERALYSNFGSDFVEIAAPGSRSFTLAGTEGLVSLESGGQYSQHLGTSFAAPLVAGAAAWVYIMFDVYHGTQPTAAEVEQLLVASGTPLKALSFEVQGCKTLNMTNLQAQVRAWSATSR